MRKQTVLKTILFAGVFSAVAACSNSGCTGPKGDLGPTGSAGLAGRAGDGHLLLQQRLRYAGEFERVERVSERWAREHQHLP